MSKVGHTVSGWWSEGSVVIFPSPLLLSMFSPQ